MRNSRRHGRLVRGLRIGLAPLCLLLPGAAEAQFSAGDLATTPLPSMPEATGGTGGAAGKRGVGSLLPNLFDQLGIYVGLSERYTDNATGSSLSPQSDWETRASFGINGSKTTAHLSAALSYAFDADYFANGVGNNENFLISNSLNANATLEAIPDHVLVQAQAYASPIYVSRLGNVVPSGQALPPGANNDIRNTYGYSLQPDFTFRLGSFLRSDLLPSYSATYFDAPTGAGAAPLGTPVISSQTSRAVTEKISSGEYFSRLEWGLIGSYSETGYSSSLLTQRSGTGELSYAIDHGISLVGDVGYQTVKARQAFRDILNGPIYMGGLKFDLARLRGEFRAGEQYHSFSLTGHLVYEMTPRLTLTADAQDGVNTPGGAMFDPAALFNALIHGVASGQIQIPSGGLTLGSIIDVVGLQNSVARFRNETVGLSYNHDDFNLNVSAYNTLQDTQTAIPTGQNPDLRSTGVFATIGHSFSQEFAGSFSASYRSDSLQVGNADSVQFGATAFYELAATTQLYIQGDYLKRFSSTALSAVPGGGDVSVASIVLGIRHTIQ